MVVADDGGGDAEAGIGHSLKGGETKMVIWMVIAVVLVLYII